MNSSSSALVLILRLRPQLYSGIQTKLSRSLGNFQRSQTLQPRKDDYMLALKKDLLSKGDTIMDETWQNMRKSLIEKYKYINDKNVDVAVLAICGDAEELHLAKSYVSFLQSKGMEPNVATFGRLLKAYFKYYETNDVVSLPHALQAEILSICARIKKQYETLDATTCDYLIHGLVTTDDWKEALDLLNMTKLTATPSVNVFSALITKAFKMKDTVTAWRLLTEALELRKPPKCKVFTTYLDSIVQDEQTFSQNLVRLLETFSKYEFVITQAVAKAISITCAKHPQLVQAANSEIDHQGKCKRCENHLRNICLSDEEFMQLSDSFLKKVLIRKDVFQKSTPAEIAEFKKFVRRTGPYDCVVDGLNVAYSCGAKKSAQSQAKLLSAVVMYFKKQNKHILILGRKHMSKWPKKVMDIVYRNASVFLANDLSHDDPLLLYAALESGPTCNFFSRDLMRSHAFLLGPELKPIFRRWQQQHQFSLVTTLHDNRIVVKEPIRQLLCAHQVKSTWHLPCKIEYSPNPPESFDMPEYWLCLNFKN